MARDLRNPDSGVVLHPGHYVRVEIECDRNRGVAEMFRHDFGGHAGREP
jgi:hypothetical protein